MEIEKHHTYKPMQEVKRRFFAMRNGIIADVLRKAGSPYRYIFGLNLPQIAEIAADYTPNIDLARDLWANVNTRESMIAAPLIYPREDFSKEEAYRWIANIPASEAADVLCHRLLRHQAYAIDLAYELAASENPMDRYVALRTMFNLVSTHPNDAAKIADIISSKPHVLTDRVAAMLTEEVAYINEFAQHSDFD